MKRYQGLLVLAGFTLASPSAGTAQEMGGAATDVAIVAAGSFASVLAGWTAADRQQMKFDETPLSEGTLYVEGINLALTAISHRLADPQGSWTGRLAGTVAGLYIGAGMAANLEGEMSQAALFALTQATTAVVVSRLWDRAWP